MLSSHPRLKSNLQRSIAVVTSFRPLKSVLLDLVGRGSIPRAVWSRLPVLGIIDVKLSNVDVFRYSVVPGDSIGTQLYWGGSTSYEPCSIAVFASVASASAIVVDVGANTGLFTLIAASANPTASIVAFEPVQNNFDRLVANVKLNGFESRVTLHCAAVSDRSGRQSFHIPEDSALPHSGSLNPDGFAGLKGKVMEVPVVTIDDLLGDRNGIDLVKIDVEGFESSVMQGMSQILRDQRPTLLVECLSIESAELIEDLLIPLSYRFFELSGSHPVNVVSVTESVAEKGGNFLCLPEESSLVMAPHRSTTDLATSRSRTSTDS